MGARLQVRSNNGGARPVVVAKVQDAVAEGLPSILAGARVRQSQNGNLNSHDSLWFGSPGPTGNDPVSLSGIQGALWGFPFSVAGASREVPLNLIRKKKKGLPCNDPSLEGPNISAYYLMVRF